MLNYAINNETGGSVNFLPVSNHKPIFGGYEIMDDHTIPPVLKLCKCGCGGTITMRHHYAWAGVPNYKRGHNRRGVSHVGENNPMWGKQQSDFNKQGGKIRMTGNKCAVGKKTPHLSELNKSRAGIPIPAEQKEKQRQAMLKYWLSADGEKQKLALSMVNQKWAADHPGHKISAAKSGHRQCPRISSLERKVETLLREAGADFIPQYEYELGFVDFLLKPNKALFINGDYWHNYPDGTEKDKRQLVYLKDHGYKTLVIWEHELEEINNVINTIHGFMEVA